MNEIRERQVRHDARMDCLRGRVAAANEYRGEAREVYTEEWRSQFEKQVYEVSEKLNALLNLATLVTEQSPTAAKRLLTEDPDNVRVRLHAMLDVLGEIGL